MLEVPKDYYTTCLFFSLILLRTMRSGRERDGIQPSEGNLS